MQILKNENWKYEICFDKLQQNEVEDFSSTLLGIEKLIINKEITHYSKYFSFEQVIKNLIYYKTEEETKNFLQLVKSKIEGIIFMPEQLKELYKIKISKAQFCQKELNSILEFACEYGVFPDMNNLYLTIFGKPIYKKILKMNQKYAKRNIKMEKEPRLSPFVYKQKIDNLKNECFKDFNAHGIWGKYSNKNFNYQENQENGKGVFKSRKLTFLNDTFVLDTNGNTINNRQLTLSFYFNIYPGYSHFYDSVINDDNNMLKFDNGASFLINGWSTFSAWHYKPSNYTRYRKDKNAKMISFLLKQNNKKGINKLYLYLLGTYGKSMALELFKYLTQYRGYIESYVLGAFATEVLINTEFCLCPSDYLNKLKNKNVGDFFASYYPSKKK